MQNTHKPMAHKSMAQCFNQTSTLIGKTLARYQRFEIMAQKLRDQPVHLQEAYFHLRYPFGRRAEQQRALIALAMSQDFNAVQTLYQLTASDFDDEEVGAFVKLAQAHKKIVHQNQRAQQLCA